MDTGCSTNNGVKDCYQDYRTANIARKRVLLAGANDGMLHAFDAGDKTGKADFTGSYAYTNGTGAELWAFVPPDLLPRLKDLMGSHQYMVDGPVMVRDIWVDGTGPTDGAKTSSAGTGSTLDGTKQSGEFHSVAIFGRRSGGNQYSALDITDPLHPTFL
jgi:type IV pilus assembly protein PilY1